ncbi:MAG TPA: ACP S-malonyltransferase [Saccharofermentans sp.]|jgi:[acyl-carrier-protein] S-malonyltransferase|nr:ACP S-malonyltransferase [Clostridia bacterium]NLX68625.1 ACP S-malonyltransferase [Clostridiaceae bacterium]HOO49437.1 ACP S-malonyltransferase [Saccharofermentans sp.]HPE27258.1 ACP S-malonyltransferase [Saccharofermentans sp.]HPJ80909.1 ACP S-malonyltransferase [Saccharofermentans sp.]
MKIAFVFPGQGCQKIGMGSEFWSASEKASKMLDAASSCCGINMRKLIQEEDEKLNITEYTQPALVATCGIIASFLEDNGINPSICAGLSLGEYSALVSAKAMRFEDAVRLTRKRGKLMQEAVPEGVGLMAAIIGLTSDQVNEVIDEIDGAYVANYNCPGQIVITGRKQSVENACEKLKEAGAKKVVVLNVSGPFHSPLLDSAGAKLREELDNIPISELTIPYVANIDATLNHNSARIRDNLQHQVASSVRWEESLKVMEDEGVDLFVEIGPGKTINGFIKKTLPNAKCINVSSIEEAESAIEYINNYKENGQ